MFNGGGGRRLAGNTTRAGRGALLEAVERKDIYWVFQPENKKIKNVDANKQLLIIYHVLMKTSFRN